VADTKITEKFEFKTSIITAYEGQEQRIKLRDLPRHYLSYDYSSMSAIQAQWLRGVLRMRQSNTLYIPMWHSPIHLQNDVVQGSKAIYIEESGMINLNRCQYIMVFDKDDYKQNNVTYKINSFGSNGLVGLESGTTKELKRINCFIFPLIRCSIQPTTGLNYVFANGTEVSVNFEDIMDMTTIYVPDEYMFNYDEDYNTRNNYNLPLTINSREVFLNKPQWISDDSLTLSIDKNTTKLDNDTGIFVYDLKNNLSYDKTSMNFYLMSKKEINNMIRFFHRMYGSLKSFYIPSWVNDISPCRNINTGTNYIYTDFDELYKFYSSNNRKKKIVIFTKDMRSYVYDILTYSYEIIDGYKYGKIILASYVTTSILLTDIKIISYINLVRFNEDSLTLNYESNIVAQTTVVFKEVDD
jgi:hypothetical protein